MSGYDRYYSTRGMIPRGSGQTTFQEDELVRVASRSTGSVISDPTINSTSNRAPIYPPATQRTRQAVVRSTSVPRMPQRRLLSGDSPRGSLSGSTGGRRSPKQLYQQSPERHDSGVGLEDSYTPKRSASSTPRFLLARGGNESEDEETFTDSAGHTIKSASPTSLPFHPSKTSPPTIATASHYTLLSKRDSTELMDTNAVIQSPTGFDVQKYQKHLNEMQLQAVEQNRLQQGLSLLLPNSDGDTGLHQAVIHNQSSTVLRLLELINKYPELHNYIDDQNALYQTPLHLAVHLQQIEVIRQLLKAGASPLLQDHKGNTPLHIACKLSSTKCLNELLCHMTQLTITRTASIRNYMGQTCVHTAVLSGNRDALRKLNRVGVNMDMEEYRSGKTPLHVAVETSSFQMVELLIQSCHVNYNAKTFSGCTPLHMAAGRGQMELVAYLISLGADPCVLTDEGDTPVELATDVNVRQFLETVISIYYN